MKRFAVTLGLLCIVAAIIGLLVIFEGDGREELLNTESREDEADETIVITDDDEEEEPEDLPRDDEEDALVGFEATPEEVSCESEVEADAEARNAEYYEGRIIVAFFDSVSRDAAVAAVEAEGYRPDSEQTKQYNANHFFTVYVDDGEEIEAVCILREKDEVKNATLDYRLDLVL